MDSPRRELSNDTTLVQFASDDVLNGAVKRLDNGRSGLIAILVRIDIELCHAHLRLIDMRLSDSSERERITDFAVLKGADPPPRCQHTIQQNCRTILQTELFWSGSDSVL